MYTRCPDCLGITWLGSDSFDETTPITCQKCRRHHTPCGSHELDEENREQYNVALAFSEANGINLPSANSVLLGLMTLGRAVEIQQQLAAESPASCAAGATAEFPDDAEETETDSSHLALGRRDPNRQVSWLREERDLPLDLSIRVVRGDLLLLEAIRLRDARIVKRALRRRRRMSLIRSAVLLFAASGLMVGAAWHRWQAQLEDVRSKEVSSPVTPQADPSVAAPQPGHAQPAIERVETKPGIRRAGASIDRDDRGRVVRVAAPSPVLVLDAFCHAESDAGSQREPVTVANARPPMSGARLGVFRDFSDLSTVHAISIRKERESGRWVAGDARAPIQSFPYTHGDPSLEAARWR